MLDAGSSNQSMLRVRAKRRDDDIDQPADMKAGRPLLCLFRYEKRTDMAMTSILMWRCSR